MVFHDFEVWMLNESTKIPYAQELARQAPTWIIKKPYVHDNIGTKYESIFDQSM